MQAASWACGMFRVPALCPKCTMLDYSQSLTPATAADLEPCSFPLSAEAGSLTRVAPTDLDHETLLEPEQVQDFCCSMAQRRHWSGVEAFGPYALLGLSALDLALEPSWGVFLYSSSISRRLELHFLQEVLEGVAEVAWLWKLKTLYRCRLRECSGVLGVRDCLLQVWHWSSPHSPAQTRSDSPGCIIWSWRNGDTDNALHVLTFLRTAIKQSLFYMASLLNDSH